MKLVARRSAAAVLAALLIAGCGSSGQGRAKLVNELAAQASGVPPDIFACVKGDFAVLPTPKLQKAVAAEATVGLTTGLRAMADCVRRGVGVGELRRTFAQKVRAELGSEGPPQYGACVDRRFDMSPPAELASFVINPAAENKLRLRIRQACLHDPTVLDGLRALLVAKVAHGLTGRVSTSFEQCLLRRTRAITTPQLRYVMLQPQPVALGQTRADALIRTWARACVASGVRP